MVKANAFVMPLLFLLRLTKRRKSKKLPSQPPEDNKGMPTTAVWLSVADNTTDIQD